VFLGGQAVSLFGDGLAVLAVPLLVLQLTRSPVAATLAAAPRTVGYLLVGLVAGPVVDRVDPWPLMIAMDALRLVSFTAMFALAEAGALPVWAVLVLAFAAGGAGVFFESALMVAVKDVFAAGALVRVNALLELAGQVARVAGPAAVGLLAVTVGVPSALLANAATFGVSLVTLLAVRRTRAVGTRVVGTRAAAGRTDGAVAARFAAGARRMAGELRDGLRYIRATRVLLAITLVQVVCNFVLGAEKLVVFFLRDTLALGPAAVSAVVVAGGLGGVLGALVAPRLAAWLGEMRVIVGGIAVLGVAFALVGVAGELPAVGVTVGVSYGVMLCAQTAAGVVNRSMRLRIVPRELTGRVFSMTRLAFGGVDPAGAAVAGVLTGALGGDPRAVFVAAGVIVTATAVTARATALRPRA
jgi:MFS family permease